jgi:uncharacterized membrane protein
VQVDVPAFVAEAIRTGQPLDIGKCWSRAWTLVMSDYGTFLGYTLLANLCMQVFVLNFIIFGGLAYYFLGRIRNERREMSDLFIGFQYMTMPLIFAGLIQTVAVSFGFLFCILPGLYLALIWLFSWHLIVDHRLNFWDAMEISRQVTNHHFGAVLLLWLTSCVLIFTGFLCLLIGLIFVVPFVWAMWAYAYEDIFGGIKRPQLT